MYSRKRDLEQYTVRTSCVNRTQFVNSIYLLLRRAFASSLAWNPCTKQSIMGSLSGLCTFPMHSSFAHPLPIPPDPEIPEFRTSVLAVVPETPTQITLAIILLSSNYTFPKFRARTSNFPKALFCFRAILRRSRTADEAQRSGSMSQFRFGPAKFTTPAIFNRERFSFSHNLQTVARYNWINGSESSNNIYGDLPFRSCSIYDSCFRIVFAFAISLRPRVRFEF